MQRVIEITSPCFLAADALDTGIQWSEIFGNDNPLALEIGCGIGDFIAKTAEEHPDVNFIAIDFYNKGCLKTCRRVEKVGLANVRVVRDEARHFIETFLTPGSLSRVYINCPDPWPKKRHRKRRLVNEEFVRFLLAYLRPGADFFFATDFDDYGVDVAAFLPKVAELENMLVPDPWRHDLSGYHLSKYMQKFMAEGKQIYFVHYRRRG